MSYSFLLLILAFSFVHADIEDHLKSALGKSAACSMPNIDFIYIINLDQRPEKYAQCIQQLSPYGIAPYRFSAVNGWELPLDVINDVGVKYHPSMDGGHWATYFTTRSDGTTAEGVHEQVYVPGRTYFEHCMARGTIGCALSHLSVLQDAYDANYETIWVMEDDIEVIQDPRRLSSLIDRLDRLVGRENWDILFTDRDTKNREGHNVPCWSTAWRPNYSPPDPSKFAKRQDISREFRQIGIRYGAYSMIVRRSGIKKILNFFKKYQLYLPYDMDFPLAPALNQYTVIEDIVSTQPQALSDNGGAFYLTP